jgi:hypothetical protein
MEGPDLSRVSKICPRLHMYSCTYPKRGDYPALFEKLRVSTSFINVLAMSKGFSSRTCLASVGRDLVVDQVAIDIVLQYKSIGIKPS